MAHEGHTTACHRTRGSWVVGSPRFYSVAFLPGSLEVDQWGPRSNLMPPSSPPPCVAQNLPRPQVLWCPRCYSHSSLGFYPVPACVLALLRSYPHDRTGRELHYPSQLYSSCCHWACACPLWSVQGSQGDATVDNASGRPLAPLLSSPTRPSPVLPICWLACWWQRELKTPATAGCIQWPFPIQALPVYFYTYQASYACQWSEGGELRPTGEGAVLFCFSPCEQPVLHMDLSSCCVKCLYMENFCITR